MMDNRTLNDIYVNWDGSNNSGGFFHYLDYYATEHTISIPFLTNIQSLDLVYHGNFSGSKLISPLLERWVDPDFFPAQAVKLAETFWKIEGERLLRLWKVYTIEYTPNWNYDMQTTTDEKNSGDDIRTLDGSSSDTTTGKTTTTQSIQGLDSSTFRNSERSETEYDGNSPLTVTHDFDEYTDKFTHGHNILTEQTRQGNIGVKTNQEMLKEEVQLWQWNFFYEVLFPAVDKLLTIPVY